jgi:hypothetical protein
MYFPRNQESHFSWIKKNLKTDGLQIDKSTKIVSMGSCFAREIKDWLLRNDFNYLLEEQKKDVWLSRQMYPGDGGKKPSEHASVAWERVYNTMTFHQIMKYSFLKAEEIDGEINTRLYETVGHIGSKKERITADLKRTRMTYPNIEVAKRDLHDHIQKSNQVLMDAEVVIFTLGFTEVWHSEERDMTLPIYPLGSGRGYYPPEDFTFKASSFEENYESVKSGIRILKENNPDVKIILTVSPVHLNMTHRADTDVVSASCASKSILRAVVDQIYKEEDQVYYFPSYEVVNLLCSLENKPAYQSDGHHVQRNIVDIIMDVFHGAYVK